MDPDLALVIGIILAVLAVPAIVSAISDRRAPRVSALTLIASGGLLVYAISTASIPYTIDTLPRVFAGVLRSYLL